MIHSGGGLQKPKFLNAGMRTLTDSQYAIMYLLHKDKTSALQQPFRSMQAKDIRIQSGLSDQTVRHQLRRYAIIDGAEDLALKNGDEWYEDLLQKLQDGEDISEYDLRRDIRLSTQFSELGIAKTAELAMEAFTDENKEIGEYYYNKNLEQQAKYAQEKKIKDIKTNKNIVLEVSSLTKGFMAQTSFSEARKKAIKMVAGQCGKTIADVTKIVS